MASIKESDLSSSLISDCAFNIKWHSHHASLVSSLGSLLQKESFVDVTLSAEGKFLHVHRLVLMACSSYFEVLVMSNNLNIFFH